MPLERNPRFTGRELELSKLEDFILPKGYTSRIAIYGLGGVGKTQVAIELAHRVFERRNCMVFWIPAVDPESFHQAYLAVAQKLDIPGWDAKDANVKRLVQRHLSQDAIGQWMIVFDNADDIEMWFGTSDSRESVRNVDYLPKNQKGTIVFTTRDRKVAVRLAQNLIDVPEMDEDQATQLLQNSLFQSGSTDNHNDNHKHILLAKLANLPLAIVQASSFVNETGCSISDYLSLLEQQEDDFIHLLSEDFEDTGRYANIRNPVATTWLISFEKILQQNSLAADYLSFMACVESKDIPISILPAGSSRKNEIEAIGVLDAYSFVARRPEKRSLDLHRLVHLATRSWLKEKGNFRDWAFRTITQISSVFPNGKDHSERSTWREYLPHALYALSADAIEKDSCWAGLARKVSWCLFHDGRFREAEGLDTQVLTVSKRIYGPEHQHTLSAMSNLAVTYRNQWKWDEAEGLQVQSLCIQKRTLGEKDPDTLLTMSNLATLYLYQSRWKEAEELLTQAKYSTVEILGEEHPDTITAMSNLAGAFWNQGRWDEAEELLIQVKLSSIKVLGEEHPKSLSRISHFATALMSQQRWKEAEELQIHVLAVSERILGDDHPDTMIITHNLACTFYKQGKAAEAIALMGKCVEKRLRVLGGQNPRTISSLQILNRWKGENLGS
jgi:tetratricopeptide (TPR) repeat protein